MLSQLSLLALALPVLAQTCADQPTPTYAAPIAASGWASALTATGLSRPRSMVFDSAGALLLLDAGVGVLHLTLADRGGTCVTVASQRTLVAAPELNHGLALSADGATLYASSADKVYAWAYSAAAGLGPANRTLVQGMDNAGHTTRTLLVANDTLVVARGSAGNEDALATDLESGHCQIRAFAATANSSVEFREAGTVLGWGLRNSVGLAVHPVTGGVWSVENSVDNLARNGVDVHRDNPGEEMNYHGVLREELAQEESQQPRNHGYPVCYAAWRVDEIPQAGGLRTGDQFSAAEDVSDEQCAQEYVAPRLTFQAHTAPLDVMFSEGGERAYVSFHGSWNRDEPVGYAVGEIEFRDGNPVAAADSTAAVREILRNPDLGACPDNCFRPVGLAQYSEDRMLVTSDSTGEIYVLQRVGDENQDDQNEDENAAAVVEWGKKGVFAVFAVWVLVCLV